MTSTDEVLGKPVHSDEKNNKVTYVTLEGIRSAEEKVEILTTESLELLKGTGRENPFLFALIESLAGRKF